MPFVLKQIKILSTFKAQLMLVFGGLAVVWLMLLGTYFVEVNADAVAKNGSDALHATAVAASELLSTEVQERAQEIELLAKSPFFVDSDFSSAKVRQMLQQRKAAHNEYLWLGVAGLDAKILQATDGILVGDSVSARPWFKAGQSGQFAGDIHEAILLAKHLPQINANQPLRFIDFASPVVSVDGKLRGVLAAHASWDWVTDAVVKKVQESLAGRQAEILIANSQGDILYPFDKVGVTQLPKNATQHKRYSVVNWLHGGDYLTSIVPVKTAQQLKLDWQVIVRQPARLAFENVQQLRIKLVTLSLASTCLFALVAYYFATKTSLPIEALAQAAKRVLQRKGDIRFPDAATAQSSEVAQLCESFQSMTQSLLDRERELSELNASLEAQVAARTAELSQANARLSELATKDPLTNIWNRRYFEQQLTTAFQLMRRTHETYTVLVLDVDHFKRINDTYGHDAGDDVLRILAKTVSEHVRNTDVFARYGGEEFAILLPDAKSESQGLLVAGKIRAAVEATHFPHIGSLTVSIGMSCVRVTDTSQDQSVKRADEALYSAKMSGRNRVAFARPNTPD